MISNHTDAITPKVNLSKKTYYLSTGLQVASGIVGMGAGFLYYGPALSCAKSDICGMWLTNLTSEKVAHTTFFLSGGLDFGGINGYFSADSIPRTIKYLQKQPTQKAKITRGITVGILAASQTAQLFIACIGTGAQAWQTVVTVLGGIPGALYGTVGIMESEFPYYRDKAKYLLKEINYKTLTRYYPLTDEENKLRIRTEYYSKQFQQALIQAHANWKQISLTALTLEITEENKKNPLGYLFQDQAGAHPATACDQKIKYLGAAIGSVMMANFTIPFQLNTLHVLQEHTAIPFLPLQLGLTAFLTASQAYSSIKITVSGVTSFLEFIKNLATRQAIDSLPFRLRPKTTMLIFGACMLFSAMSYSVANLITTKDYDGPEKETFRYGAMLGIVTFHLTGLLHLYQLLLSRLTSNEREKFIFTLHQALTNLERLPLSDYIKSIEAPAGEMRNNIGVNVFPEQLSEARDLEKASTPLATIVEEVDEEDEEENKPQQSWLKSWCCFNRPKKSQHTNNIDHEEKLLPRKP